MKPALRPIRPRRRRGYNPGMDKKASPTYLRAKRAGALPNPMPPRLNKTGHKLGPEMMKRIERGVAEVKRGKVLDFDTEAEHLNYLFGPKP